jgi:hypothetical protein
MECNIAELDRVDRLALLQKDLHTVRLVFETTANTTGAGAIVDVFGSNPSNCAGWTNLAAVFDEYRTLAIRLKFRPLRFETGSSTLTLAPIGVVADYDTATALSSYAGGALYSSYQEYSAGTQFSKVMLMSGAENAQFLTTGSPSSSMYLKTFSSNNTISLLIGRWECEYYVQFRGKGV